MSVALYVVLNEDIPGFDHECTLVALCAALEDMADVATEHGLPDLAEFADFEVLEEDELQMGEDEEDEEWPEGEDEDDEADGFRSFDRDDDDEDDEEEADDDDDDDEEDGPWFDPAEALPTVNALLDHYRDHGDDEIVEELELLHGILSQAQEHGRKFNIQIDY